ncbi:hypothetical protein J2R99_002189 [Rhodopseudomonas julia]|uniref:Uncharacterized protein n=1 Tax=Rhodopseudomonas julia TaxID=200617 RepID=A0ABU0C750_9BRAD|nr:hypothetical protein [Rhodopseudomonas julia]MDQ0326320.1 hypothetical protein [Rhodopseudomonas julia]
MSKEEDESRWLRTDEPRDVAGSIRHALRSADFANEDPQAWKWVLLALHSALQGACVCHLTTTAQPVGALTKKSTKAWRDYLNTQGAQGARELPETRLLEFYDLLKAIRKPNSVGSGAQSPGIAISDVELKWLKRVHKEIRNQFIHFEPTGWSIELSGVPELARLIARIVNEVLDADWAFRHLEDAERGALQADISRLAANNWLPDITK